MATVQGTAPASDVSLVLTARDLLMVSLKQILSTLAPILLAPWRAMQLLPLLYSTVPPISTSSQYHEDILAAADILEDEGFLRSMLLPQPQQCGQRITKEWLEGLQERDCLWQFRYVLEHVIRF